MPCTGRWRQIHAKTAGFLLIFFIENCVQAGKRYFFRCERMDMLSGGVVGFQFLKGCLDRRFSLFRNRCVCWRSERMSHPVITPLPVLFCVLCDNNFCLKIVPIYANLAIGTVYLLFIQRSNRENSRFLCTLRRNCPKCRRKKQIVMLLSMCTKEDKFPNLFKAHKKCLDDG